MEWIDVRERLPPFDQKVKVKVPDLSYLMIGIELFLPAGENFSVYKSRPAKCSINGGGKNYLQNLHWTNNAGLYCTHWMPLSDPPKE